MIHLKHLGQQGVIAGAVVFATAAAIAGAQIAAHGIVSLSELLLG